MKKIIAFLLAAVMCLSLAACGGNGTPASKDGGESQAKIKAGFIFLHDENSTYDLNFINGMKEACEALGIEYISKTNIPEGWSATTRRWILSTMAAASSLRTRSVMRIS